MKSRTVLYLVFFVFAGALVAANCELLVRSTEIDLIISTAAVPGILIAIFLARAVLLVDWSFHPCHSHRMAPSAARADDA